MRLSVKLFLGILFIAVMASGATGSYFYYQARAAMLDSIRDQLKATAKISAMLVDGDILRELTEPDQTTSPEYLEIQELMGIIAQTSQEYLFAYTMRLENGQVRFIVDSPAHDDDGDGIISEDELPEPIGTLYPDPPMELLQGFVRPSSDERPHYDQWGASMSGYAPIHDSAGRPVALIGIDMTVATVEGKLAAIRQAGLISLFIALVVAMGMSWYFSRSIFRPLGKLQQALGKVGEGDYSQRLEESGPREIVASARSYNAMVTELREKALMKNSLGKILGTEAMDHLLKNRLELGGEMHNATLLVCDLRGFSRLCQKLPPKLLVGLLNDYLTAMVEVIQRHGGIVDKFVGDMVLAVFGHPVPLEQEQRVALSAAKAMVARCDELNEQLRLGPELRLRNSIGLHSGPVLAGNIGSPERMEYTVMGHAVNVASRIERLTRPLDVRIAASADFTLNHDKGHGLTSVGTRPLPGMDEELEIYVLQGGDEETRSV
ncbi:adenylate/guanylate cyclase domain-containing protein [Desulfonatronum lacustre]|uniref:adenylate/guanylate cyclase domain-containing protein n=1 Tax=Desulfonatronum lacustre TaxID=66849 RepID=UPI00048F2466|nr:adenylate/guanylate cyclase domain-containing protein [Desulfonatronum lacustre]SMP64163.1 adenylate cyclase [Desulfonatronum zhilinae]